MHESTKSAKRRFYDGNFIRKYFVGDGIDVGAGADPLVQWQQQFPLIKSIKTWDIMDGDAELLATEKDASYDFVHASHCLEHMEDWRSALDNWCRVLKRNGYMIFTVPDEDLYEQGNWPSRWTNEHLWSFTIYKSRSAMPKSVNILDLVKDYSDRLMCERIVLVDDFYRPQCVGVDQTLFANAECAIEVIFRKIA